MITYPRLSSEWDTSNEHDSDYKIVTLYSVNKGGWATEAKKFLKKSSYRKAQEQINQSAPNLGDAQYVSDGKYKQILWSIKKLNIPDELAFLS